jgi:hypothetical protein
MKSIFETGDVGDDLISFRETIPFWFAVLSPFIGVLMGLLGAWFVAWIST